MRGKISKRFASLAVIVVVLLAAVIVNFFNHSSDLTYHSKAATWYDYDWPYRTAITIDNTKVDADLTDFPVLISSTNADWADTSNGGHVGQSDGGDLVFTTSDSVTKLSHEIVKYDNTTGQLVAWVKVPTVADLSNTVINLYFGNGSAENQWDTNNVWGSYSHVWHLSESSWAGVANEVKDSTISARNGTASGGVTTTTGKIFKAGNFDGGDDFVNFGDNDDLTPPTTVTFQAWIKTTASDDYDCVYCKWAADEYIFGTMANLKEVQTFKLVGAGGWGDDYYNEKFSTGAISSGQWTRLTVTKTGTTLSFYLNGTASGTGTIANAAFVNGTASAHIGAQAASNRAFTGQIEDVRVVSSALSAEWIAAEYNNQNSPATFYSLAETEQGDSTPPSNVTTVSGYNTSEKTDTLTSGNWDGYNTPYFEFSGAVDNESGVKGYYIYFGTNSSADAFTDGSYQAHSGAQGSTQNFTAGSLTNGETYYMIIGTENNATSNNRSDSETKYTYKYDPIAPASPEYVNISPVGCSTQTSFTFTWPAALDTGGSGLLGYQYKRGSAGTVTDHATTTLSTTSYQDGDNILYVRSIDNAGNTSSWQTAIFCSTSVVQVIDGPAVSAGPSSITVTWTSSKATTGYVKVYEGNTYISEQGLTTYDSVHSVKVIGLEPEKAYRYQITWSDQSGNIGETDWYSTNTATAPQINDLAADVLSPSSVNVSWNSTIAANYTLEYGIGNYGTSVVSTDWLTGYSTKLSGLSAGQTYQLRVNATGQDGTKFFAGESFAMPPLPAISGIKFEPIANRPDTALKISWSTNTETTSSIFYSLPGESKKEVSKSDKVMQHELEIGNLSDNSKYEIYVTGIDSFGNIAKSSTTTFTTDYDTRPPQIDNISTESSNVGSGRNDNAQVTVGFVTDEPAKCSVEYGAGISGENYSGQTATDDILQTNHILVLSDLAPQSAYHFKIVCNDSAGNRSESLDQTVISGEINQSVFNIIIKTLNNLFGWLGSLTQ